MSVELSLVIPAYNEEASIEKTVYDLSKKFEEEKINYELILINNGSKDNTKKIIESLSKKNKRIKVLNLKKNVGFGGGIMYGFKHSRGKYIGFDCADGEVPSEYTFKLYATLIKNSYNIVKGLRFKRKERIFRIMTSYIFNFLIKIRFRLKLKDINGYPVFIKKENYVKIIPERKDFIFNLDLYNKAMQKKYQIVEIPVVSIGRMAGRSSVNLWGTIKMAWNLLEYSI